jgi:hypothetical protein
MLISFLASSLTLKVEAILSIKMLGDFQWTTQHYIPEDETLHEHLFSSI